MFSSVLRRPVARWAVPAAVATVVAGAAVAGPMIAGADSELPDRSAAELLTDLAGADRVPFAGTIVQSADVGLPEIPGTGAGSASSMSAAGLSLLSGSTTARIWYADSDTFRIALQDELAETDLIRDGEDMWFWNSEHNTVSQLNVPAGQPDAERFQGGPGSVTLPTEAAALALGAIAPSTQVDVDGTATVAGRAAYELVLRPRDEQSLIGSIRLAIDAEHSVPLRVQIYGSDGGDPAFEVGFTSVSFAEPDQSVFEFTPPDGAQVEDVDPETLKGEHDIEDRPDGWSVVGEGWTSVLVVRGVHLDEITENVDAEMAPLVEAVLGEFDEVSGPYGEGVAFSSDLVTVLVLDDGRLLAGAVPLEVLEEAAQDPQAAL